MKKWWKIDIKTGYRDSLYTQANTAQEALMYYELLGVPYEMQVNEIEPGLVPYKIRAFAEATTEELVDQLRKKGWKVALS